jgi:hypothetical protein
MVDVKLFLFKNEKTLDMELRNLWMNRVDKENNLPP